MLETRNQMIRDTNAFLSWALRQDRRSLPRIPRRPVERGGWALLLRDPAVRQRVHAWWLDTLSDLGSKLD